MKNWIWYGRWISNWIIQIWYVSHSSLLKIWDGRSLYMIKIPSHQKPWNLGTPLPQQILARQGNHLHHLQRPFISLRPRFYTTQHTTPPRERERERGKFEIGETKGMWFLGVTTNHLDLCKNAISGKWYISVGALWRAINDNFGLTPWTFVNPLICIKSHTPKQREILPFPYISSFTRNSSIISLFFLNNFSHASFNKLHFIIKK